MDGVADFPVAAGESAAAGLGAKVLFGGDDIKGRSLYFVAGGESTESCYM